MHAPDIDSINHVGMAVRKLADTAARYEAMGFMLTPYSPHSGASRPGETVVPLNSGNRCVMFAHNYLEILASADPSQPAPKISNFLKRHQGAHVICFGSEQVESVDGRLKAEVEEMRDLGQRLGFAVLAALLGTGGTVAWAVVQRFAGG